MVRGMKEKQLKIEREERKGKKEDGTERDAGPQGNPKIPKGGRLINQKASVSMTS